MSCKLSVIVCTYNPNPEVFQRCMASVQSALESVEDAEVIVVDNDSSAPVEGIHRRFPRPVCQTRFVREEKRGLTSARLRGIRESKGDLMVFVDDDNFVRLDFFAQGLRISQEHPFVGAFSGQIHLMFEKEPAQWTIPYHGMLVKRVFKVDLWSNLPTLDETMPCGAGLFVRKAVAHHYVWLHDTGKRRIQLDRSGDSLFSGGDNDLAACACDIGLGVGLFHDLVTDHYIPAHRLEKTYLLRLMQGIYASGIVVKSLRGEYPVAYSFGRRVLDGLRLILMNPLKRDFYRAQLRGEAEGRRMLGL
jgi:glycosyltransferase involved in cell wall biosynthesis